MSSFTGDFASNLRDAQKRLVDRKKKAAGELIVIRERMEKDLIRSEELEMELGKVDDGLAKLNNLLAALDANDVLSDTLGRMDAIDTIIAKGQVMQTGLVEEAGSGFDRSVVERKVEVTRDDEPGDSIQAEAVPEEPSVAMDPELHVPEALDEKGQHESLLATIELERGKPDTKAPEPEPQEEPPAEAPIEAQDEDEGKRTFGSGELQQAIRDHAAATEDFSIQEAAQAIGHDARGGPMESVRGAVAKMVASGELVKLGDGPYRYAAKWRIDAEKEKAKAREAKEAHEKPRVAAAKGSSISDDSPLLSKPAKRPRPPKLGDRYVDEFLTTVAEKFPSLAIEEHSNQRLIIRVPNSSRTVLVSKPKHHRGIKKYLAGKRSELRRLGYQM